MGDNEQGAAAESNIDTFNRAVVLILGRLLDVFPVEMRVLDTRTLEEGADNRTVEVFTHTVNFLEKEGFIRARAIAQFGAPLFGNVGLTMHGLHLLDALHPPAQPSWKERIRDAIATGGKKGAAIVGRELMQALAKEGFRAASQGIIPS